MKNSIRFIAILSIFGFFNIATSKSLYFPCEYPILSYLGQDSLVRSYYMQSSRDTIIIKAYKDSLWDIKTAAICKILKDSCRINKYKILVVDTSYDQSTWNTPYGKSYFFRQCP